MKTSLMAFVPTRSFVQNLQVGDLALDCFGKLSPVTSIFAQRDDIKGKAFVCYYTKHSENSSMSHSMKEGEVVYTMEMSRWWKQTCLVPDTNKSSDIMRCGVKREV